MMKPDVYIFFVSAGAKKHHCLDGSNTPDLSVHSEWKSWEFEY